MGSFNASHSLELSASLSVGTLVTARGTICFRPPKAKSNRTCAAKISAISVNHRLRVQRTSAWRFSPRRSLRRSPGCPRQSGGTRFGGSSVHGAAGAVTTRGKRGEQRVCDAGIAREQRQMNQLVLSHGFVGVNDERERRAGIFRPRCSRLEFNCASLTIDWRNKTVHRHQRPWPRLVCRCRADHPPSAIAAKSNSRRRQKRAQHQKNHEQKKNGRERRHVKRAAQQPGIAGKFHDGLPLPFSVTMLTISAAARSMSRTILLMRLTR